MDEFSNYKRVIGGRNDWFTTDFTLAELKSLRLKQERGTRDPSFDNKFQIPSFEEFIQGEKWEI